MKTATSLFIFGSDSSCFEMKTFSGDSESVSSPSSGSSQIAISQENRTGRMKKSSRLSSHRSGSSYFPPCLLLVSLWLLLSADHHHRILGSAEASMLTVKNGGEYQRVTVKISEDVPRQFCQQVLDNVEVRRDT